MRLEPTFEATTPICPEGAPVLLQRLSPRTGRRGPRLYRPAVWTLEDRMLLSQAPRLSSSSTRPRSPLRRFSSTPGRLVQTANLGTITSPTGATHPLSAVPALSSLPGAPASLYLNFLGDSTPSYGEYSNIITPAYDQDGDPTTFSDAELAAIQKIWSCVAEDYAPFNINVTTVPPANMAHGVTEKVDIGGDGAWTGGKSGGLCYVNDFTVASVPNIAFVFSQNLAGGNARYTGDAASHESGHGFGLNHQSTYSGTTLVQEYSTGPGDGTAPLMGSSYAARRSLWWYGPSDVSSTTYQDDMAVIARPTNGFGYRPEPADSTPASAFPLVVQNGTQVSAAGLIIHPTDLDYYSFTSGPGVVSFTVSVPADVSNLAPRIAAARCERLDRDRLGRSLGHRLLRKHHRDPAGRRVLPDPGRQQRRPLRQRRALFDQRHDRRRRRAREAAPEQVLDGTGTGTVALNPPAAVSATAVSSGRIDLTWAAVPGATGFQIERASSQGSWAILGTTTAGITVFSDVSVAPGTTYAYRVRAIGSGQTSSPSAVATAATPPAPVPPAAVSRLTVVSKAPRQVVLAWTPSSSGAQGYIIERSTNGKNWVVVGRVAAGSSGFTDKSVAPGKTYVYRVRAYNPWGFSKVSPVARVATPRVAVQPLRQEVALTCWLTGDRESGKKIWSGLHAAAEVLQAGGRAVARRWLRRSGVTPWDNRYAGISSRETRCADRAHPLTPDEIGWSTPPLSLPAPKECV